MQVGQSPQLVTSRAACAGFKPGGPAQAKGTIGACEEAGSLCNVSLVWPLDSLEGKALVFHSSRLCMCHLTSKLMHQMAVMLNTPEQSSSSLHSWVRAQQLRGPRRHSGWLTQLLFLPGDHASQF